TGLRRARTGAVQPDAGERRDAEQGRHRRGDPFGIERNGVGAADMQFGLFMMPLHPPERPFAESYTRDLAQIALADRLGYHEVWIGEHFTERWENAPAHELLIAQALLQTERIIL